MAKGVLVDLAQCIGCRSCQVACKQWNDLPAAKTSFSATRDNPLKLSKTTWTKVEHKFLNTKEGLQWKFVKRQCMHCLEPACAAACFMGVLKKTPEGPVIVVNNKCIGCYYCNVACPFEVPNYEWIKGVPRVQKCRLCYDPGGEYDRLGQNRKPACVTACTTGALKFGDREELLAEAKSRISGNAKYVDYVYGEKDEGGTSWLYISSVPFVELGFPDKSKGARLWHTMHSAKTG
ncbi:MAG: 4Fe-4S dicluster domain-containing protein [Bacillota bacterium]